MICNHCGQDLPKKAFSPKRSTCKKCEAEKEASYRINREIKESIKDKFNIYYGGYIVAILNHVREKEYKYTIKGTNGFMVQTNDLEFFKKKLDEICQEPRPEK